MMSSVPEVAELLNPQIVQIADVGQQPKRNSGLQNFVLRLEKRVTPNVGVVQAVLLYAGGNLLDSAQIK
jgi:hypothetical protein